MEKLPQEIIDEICTISDAELWQVYGKPKQGKTWWATQMAYRDLMQGLTVVCNWKIDWHGYDERDNKWLVFLGLIGLKRDFKKFPIDNFIYWDPTDERIPQKLAYMTDCVIYLDEGQRYYDSYLLTRMDALVRMSLALTGHFNRKIVIVSQRTMAIHVSLRGNVHRFFKCVKGEKMFKWFGLQKFYKYEFQDTNGENVVEDEADDIEIGYGTKKSYLLYDYKFMRGDAPRSQINNTEIYLPEWKEIWDLFFKKQEKSESLPLEAETVFVEDLEDNNG